MGNQPSHSVLTASQDRGQAYDPVAYTHPVTQISLTRSELSAYERGVVTHVVDNNGNSGSVKVYFRPSFVEDDPWKGLQGNSH